MPSAMLVWHENARLESCHLGDHDRRTMEMRTSRANLRLSSPPVCLGWVC